MSHVDLVGLPLSQALARCPGMTGEHVRFTAAPKADTKGCTARVIDIRGDEWLAGWFRDHVTPKENDA